MEVPFDRVTNCRSREDPTVRANRFAFKISGGVELEPTEVSRGHRDT